MQQVGLSDPVCVVEPIVGRQQVAPVIPESFAVPIIGAAWGNHAHLRGAKPGLRPCVLRRGGELSDLAQHQPVGRVVEGFGSNVIVLNIDPIERDIAERLPLPVNHCDESAMILAHASLQLQKIHWIAVKNRQLFDLLSLNRIRQLRPGGAHQIGVSFNRDRVRNRANLESNRWHGIFRRSIQFDPVHN